MFKIYTDLGNKSVPALPKGQSPECQIHRNPWIWFKSSETWCRVRSRKYDVLSERSSNCNNGISLRLCFGHLRKKKVHLRKVSLDIT